ncbi:MAG: hypothetical protein ACSHX7_09615, partial [Luteolibacter sp.]
MSRAFGAQKVSVAFLASWSFLTPNMLDSFQFSKRQLRDASRLAIQAAIASAVLFIVMKTLNMPEKFVGVLSTVLVLSPGVGGTLASAWKRFAA